MAKGLPSQASRAIVKSMSDANEVMLKQKKGNKKPVNKGKKK